MTQEWQKPLKFDVTSALLSSNNKAVIYFTERDLLDKNVHSIKQAVWELPEVKKAFKKQQTDGSWKHNGKETPVYPKHHDTLVETWKAYHLLVERYQVTKEHEAARKAAEFFFTCQTSQGDIRGMIGNQYATYYTGAILAVLIKTGYADDPRVEKGMQWLLSMRQNDGGWTIPLLTHKLDKQTWLNLTSKYAEPLELYRSKPFSHNWTDMVLRAFAVHPKYRCCKEARAAGDLLKSSFFMPDYYTSYQDSSYWVRFCFWWPNLVTALESLCLMCYSKSDPDIWKGLSWLIENQAEDGLWNLSYVKGAKDGASVNAKENRLWLTLRIARFFKRFFL
ncbi:MAG: prenyltransferase/squalene oxidase repeat-containing protein [Candidatus Bathyarchaeia archaeon]